MTVTEEIRSAPMAVIAHVTDPGPGITVHLEEVEEVLVAKNQNYSSAT